MIRTSACAVVGAGVGFLGGFAGVTAVLYIVVGEKSDTVAIGVFSGVFLAGAGAVAGAVIGGVADSLARGQKADRH